MSLEYRDEGRGVVFRCTGVVTEADLLAANAEIYGETRLRRLGYQLIDFSRAERVDVSPDGVRALARQDARAARERPDLIVVVVPVSELGFGMSRMWAGHVESSGERLTPHVARTVEEAEAWLAEQTSRDPD